MFTGHASAIANDERGMERRNGFLVTTIPKVLGQVVFEDAIAVDGYRSVLGDAREAVNVAIRQRPGDIGNNLDSVLLQVACKGTVNIGQRYRSSADMSAN